MDTPPGELKTKKKELKMKEIKLFLRYFLGTNVIVFMNGILKYVDPKIGGFWFWESIILWSLWVGYKYLEEKDEENKSNGSSSDHSINS